MIQDAIKKFAAEQILYKPQRRSIHFKGERMLEPKEAASKVAYNNYHLRHLYIVYDILRERKPSLPPKKDYSQYYIDQLVQKYSIGTGSK